MFVPSLGQGLGLGYYPLTELDHLIDWLGRQRPNRRYQTTWCVYTCLFGRYVRSRGVGRGAGLLGRLRAISAESNRLYFSGWGMIANGGQRTYGAALARARRLRGW